MKLQKKSVYLSLKKCLAFFLFIVMLIGCSDSETSVGPDPDPDTTEDSTITLQGSVSGPAEVTSKTAAGQTSSGNLEFSESDRKITAPDNEEGVRGAHTIDKMEPSHVMAEGTLSGEVPLSDVTVSLYEASDYISNQSNATLLASATTDSEGNYSFSDIDEGLDLVVVVDSNPRLTSVIIEAVEQSNGSVNSATAVVSEYWAGEIANGRTLNQSDFDEMLQTAEDLLDGISAGDLYNVLVELVPNQFGDGFPGNLSPSTNHFLDQLLDRVIMACADIEFSTLSARPGAFVLIQNMPEELGEDPYGWIYSGDDKDELSPMYIGKTTDGEWEFYVPIHPDNYLEGGEVQIMIRSEDEMNSCGQLSFEIESLTPAPGTFSEMVNALEGSAEEMSDMIGYSRDELFAQNIDDLEPYAAILKSVLTVIDGPDHQSSLKATLNGDISENLLDLYDAILSEAIGSDDFEKQVSSTQSVTPFLPELPGCNVPLNGLSGGFAIPEDLDCWMNVNGIFEDFNQNEFQTYYDFQSRAFTLMAAIPDPQVQEIASMGETYLQFMKMMLGSFEFLFPGELLGIELEAEPQFYAEEDDDTEGEWEASVVAHAKDWEFDMLLSLAVLPIGAGKGGVMLSKFKKQSQAVEILIENTLDNVQGELQKTGIGVYTFEAQVFGPIKIDPLRDEDYFNWELNTKSQETNLEPFAFTTDEKGYIPQAVGTTDLKIETKGGAVFKGQNAFSIAELEVAPISVEIGQWISEDVFTENESPYYIDVGEEFTLYAHVTNALNKDVEWTRSPASSGLYFMPIPGRDNVVEVFATEPGSYTIDAESIADTGPREDKTPRRFDQVTILVGGLNVFSPGCVETNSSFQLTARLSGEPINFSDLEWSIQGSGSIDSNGMYTAGAAGSVVIDFHVRGQPNLKDSISFSVKEMCSSFSLTSSEFNISGECVFFTEREHMGLTTISFDYNKTPRGWISINEVLRDIMSPDQNWSVEDPGWNWVSVVMKTVLEPFGFASDEQTGPRSFVLNHEIKIINGSEVRTLSGFIDAEHLYKDSSGEEQSTHVYMQFTGAQYVSSTSDWVSALGCVAD